MELTKKDYKFINNTGEFSENMKKNLPLFNTGGLPDAVAWKNTPGYMRQSGMSSVIPGQSFPKPGYFDISGAQKGVQNMMKLTPNIPYQNVDPKQKATFVGGESDSRATAVGPWFALGSWTGGGVLEGLGQIKSAEEHLADAGTSTANINGISYTQQNGVNTSKIMQDYDQSTKSDFLTNPFRGITKLFGRNAAKRNARNAAEYANIQQIGARDNAYAQYLRLDNAKKYGNVEDLSLYAANGKLPKFVDGKPTYTAAGETNMLPNAKLSGGEIVYNKAGIASEVGGPVNNKDQQYGFLRASDGVLSNKPGIYGYSPADMFRATGNIDASEDYMILSNLAKGRRMYNNGKLPKLAEGWLGNFIPSILGTAASLDLMYQAYRNKPYRPNTYAANPYESEALTTLAGLRVNPYPIMNQLRSAEARTNRAIDIAGGLSGSQRTAARLANLNTTQNNISKLLSDIQQQNNAYRANYAQAALDAGNKSRAARISANQWDLDMYAKAHAARNRGIQTGIANMLAQIQQYLANEFKRRQFNDTMELYRDDMDQRKKNFEWMANHNDLNISQNADPIKNPSSRFWNQLLPSEKLLLLYNRGIIK